MVTCIVASALFSVMDDLSKIQLQQVVMQATGHLPFTPMLLAGRLHGRLYICLMFWFIKSGVPGKVTPGKVKQLLAIDQTSDWLLAIHFVLGKVGRLFN